MKPRILIADDNPVMRELMMTILEDMGCQVTVAEDGLAAWEEIARDRPMMAVLDIEMPHLDGSEICRRVKSHPETRGIPVLLVSGARDAASQAHTSGADGFLAKPFRLDELRMQVDSLLGQTNPREAPETALL